MTSWTERVVTWGFALLLSSGMLFLFMLGGTLVDVYVHPLAAIPIYVVGAIFTACYFREMTKE